MIDLDELTLPPRIHAELSGGRDVVTGEHIEVVIVWADRVDTECSRCHEPIARDPGRPAMLNTGAGQGGRVEEFSQQHGCGNWLSVAWSSTSPDEDAVMFAAGALAGARVIEVDEARIAMRERLTADLRAAVTRLAEPLADGETTEDREAEVGVRGPSDLDPGLFREDDGELAIWDYVPDGGEGDVIIVHASDLEASD